MMTRTKTLFAATMLLFSATVVVWAQVQNGPDFDPATRAIHNLAAPPSGSPAASGTTPAAGELTPEQIAEQQKQQRLAQVAAAREEGRKRAAAAEKARQEKMAAAKAANEKRMKAQKEQHAADMKKRKDAHEQIKQLQKEEVTARKAYRDSLKNATGKSRSDTEDQFRKAEQDRRKKLADLRHPKRNMTSSSGSSSSSSSGTTGSTTGSSLPPPPGSSSGTR